MNIQLIIKSAAQTVEDFKIDCQTDWTVERVKEEISTVYPTKPNKEHQKLIHGGKLLQNHLLLKSIFNEAHDLHVLHLVCPIPPRIEPVKKYPPKENNAMPAFVAPPINPTNPYVQMNPQMPIFPGFSYSGGLATMPDATAHYLTMQQMYTQLMTQYLSQYNGAIPVGTTIPPPTAPPEAPRPQQPQQARGPFVNLMDLMFTMTRVTMLTILLLFYSSPLRLLTLLLITTFVTWLIWLKKEYQREQQQERQVESTRQETNDNETAEDSHVTENSTSASPSSDAVPAQPRPPSFSQNIFNSLCIAFTLFKAFFVSLIPEDPVIT